MGAQARVYTVSYFLVLVILLTSSVTLEDFTFKLGIICLLSIFNALLPNSNTNPIVIINVNNNAIVQP